MGGEREVFSQKRAGFGEMSLYPGREYYVVPLSFRGEDRGFTTILYSDKPTVDARPATPDGILSRTTYETMFTFDSDGLTSDLCLAFPAHDVRYVTTKFSNLNGVQIGCRLMGDSVWFTAVNLSDGAKRIELDLRKLEKVTSKRTNTLQTSDVLLGSHFQLLIVVPQESCFKLLSEKDPFQDRITVTGASEESHQPPVAHSSIYHPVRVSRDVVEKRIQEIENELNPLV